MIRFRTAWWLARSETRRARGTLVFCVLSIALGVLAITSIRTLTNGMRSSIDGQAQRLMGADLTLQGSEPLTSGTAAELGRELASAGARATSSVRFYSMLAAAATSGAAKSTQLVRIRAVGDAFPLYGSIDSSPPGRFGELGARPSILLDPAVARTLGVAPGGRVRLGQLELEVLGEFVKTPGSVAAEFSMAPYAFVHERFLEQTGLLATGSRIQYEALYALPEGMSADVWKDDHWDRAIESRLSLRTSKEAASNVRRFLTRLSGFMTVVGLVTLFLGALGIGSAMRSFMSQKLDHAAVLRCVGATSKDLFLVYSLLSLLVAFIGSVVGAIGGSVVPMLLGSASAALGAGLLPAELVLRPSVGAVLHGVAAGTISTLAFTLVPIWRTSVVAPLRVLGRTGNALEPVGVARFASLVGLGVALLTVFVLALAETESLRIGASFTVAIALALGVLFGLARAIVALALRVGPKLRSFHLRQGIANLHRPGNQTSAVVVAVGMGFLLLGTLLILQTSMQRLLELERRDDLPNLFVIDIQPDQRESVLAALGGPSVTGLELSPMISARIGGVNGHGIDQSHVQRNEEQRSWEDRMRTREYFISYRGGPIASETVTAGQFWSGRPSRQEASLDEGMAQSLGIHLGDTLTLDIQGLPLDATVTSFREIRWQALRPNAMILLSPGEIESAPTMFVASARVPDGGMRQTLTSDLVRQHGNLTVIDAAEAAQTVLSILDRVSAVFTLLGVLSVLAGAVILGGAIAAGRFARQREAMLFKVLGASRSDLRRILSAEYATLALLGTLSGWLLAELIGRAAVPALFDAAAHVPYVALGTLGLGALVLNTAVGLLVGRRVSGHTPLSILREE
ncbi:MAG TPA: FtsX-like permease family protein [Polyangiaceae bacterium]|nr:FtsX-like permease family protein [Polyangiaceae bacterium]